MCMYQTHLIILPFVQEACIHISTYIYVYTYVLISCCVHPRVEWRGFKNLRAYFNTQNRCFLFLQISVDFSGNLWRKSECQNIAWESLAIIRVSEFKTERKRTLCLRLANAAGPFLYAHGPTYMYVCVCVCVYLYIGIHIRLVTQEDINRHKKYVYTYVPRYRYTYTYSYFLVSIPIYRYRHKKIRERICIHIPCDARRW